MKLCLKGDIKMKKLMAIILTTVMAITVFAACGKADPVADDLINYNNNQIQPVIDAAKPISADYASITGSNYTSDTVSSAKLKDVIIPASDALVAKATAIVPTTDEVKKLHAVYVSALTTRNEGYKLLLDAATKGDATMVTAANAKFEAANKLVDQFNVDFPALKKAHGMTDTK